MVLIGDLTKTDESVQSPLPFAGSTSRDMTLANGTQAVVGIGFRPSCVILLACIPGTATEAIQIVASPGGAVNSRSNFDRHNQGANTMSCSTTATLYTGVGIFNEMRVNTMDADGFTLDFFNKSGAPAGTLQVGFVAFK